MPRTPAQLEKARIRRAEILSRVNTQRLYSKLGPFKSYTQYLKSLPKKPRTQAQIDATAKLVSRTHLKKTPAAKVVVEDKVIIDDDDEWGRAPAPKKTISKKIKESEIRLEKKLGNNLKKEKIELQKEVILPSKKVYKPRQRKIKESKDEDYASVKRPVKKDKIKQAPKITPVVDKPIMKLENILHKAATDKAYHRVTTNEYNRLAPKNKQVNNYSTNAPNPPKMIETEIIKPVVVAKKKVPPKSPARKK